MSEQNPKETKDAKSAKKVPARAGSTNKATRQKAKGAKTGAAAAKEQSEAKVDKKQTPPPSRPDTPKTPEKPLVTRNTEERGISGVLFGLLFIAVLAGGGYATQPLWTPYIVGNQLAQDKIIAARSAPDALGNRLSKIENEIANVRETGEGIADLEQQRNSLNVSIEGVLERIEELEKQIDYVRGMQQATLPPSDAVNTNESLQRLSSRMNLLEESGETVKTVMERLARLEQAMVEIDSGAGSSAEQLSKTMAEISARIVSLESGGVVSDADLAAAVRSEKQVRAQTLVLAVGHLREILRTSGPYLQALGALEALGKGDPEIMRGINELAPYAQSGIPSMNSLRRDYSDTISAIRTAAPKTAGAQGSGVIDKALDSIKSLVSIRKTGSPVLVVAAQGPLVKARAQLGDGDLAGAVATLTALPGMEKKAAAPWLAKARARLTAETALSRLHVVVVSLLAPVQE